MYEKKLNALRAEVDALRRGTKTTATENTLQLPLALNYDEILERNNDGFSKKFVKIARQAALVALKKEPNLNCAAASVVNYLRETRKSQNWLCLFGKSSEEIFMRCHKVAEVIFTFSCNGLEYNVRIAELDS